MALPENSEATVVHQVGSSDPSHVPRKKRITADRPTHLFLNEDKSLLRRFSKFSQNPGNHILIHFVLAEFITGAQPSIQRTKQI